MNMVNTNSGLLFILVFLMALQNQIGHITELGTGVANKKCIANNQHIAYSREFLLQCQYARLNPLYQLDDFPNEIRIGCGL